MPQPLSIVVTIHNEEKAIDSTVSEFKELIKKLPKGSEIILINDGSSDNTKKELQKYIDEKLENFVFLEHEVNCGYGAGLKTGMRQARNDLIAITDADQTYPNNEFPKFLKMMRPELSMIVGARIKPDAEKDKFLRRIAKNTIRLIASYMAGRKIPDLNSGMRIMRKDLVYKYMDYLPNGFSLTSTITLAALVNGYQVKYIPIDYYKREGKSHIKPIKDTLNFINLILTTVLAFQPFKFFFPLTLISFLIFLIIIIKDVILLNITDSSLISFLIFINSLSLTIVSNILSKKS